MVERNKTWSPPFPCRVLSKHFCLQSFFPKIQSLYCFLTSAAPWGGPMKEKEFKFMSADCWKIYFSWIFLGILEFYGEFLRKVDWRLSTFNIRLSCMHLCKYLNQRLTRIGEWNSKSFQDVLKTKKKNMKKLSFITYFKIEFLLPLTSCRKVFGKMPALLSCESSVSVNKSPDRKKKLKSSSRLSFQFLVKPKLKMAFLLKSESVRWKQNKIHANYKNM